jgi:single-stranded-DNA-specific exonuclease
MNAVPKLRRRVVPVHGPWPPDFPPVLQRVLAARGVLDHASSELRLAKLLPPDTLGGLDAACALLRDAIAADRRIVVVGDFDCDGATGTAVAVRGLRLLGARHIDYRVPNRATHGYGLSPALVEDIAPMAPDLLLTVDHGIACHAGIAAAKARGWQVVVTDHHLPGATLPACDALVNPNAPGDGFPSKALAGVGVVFYLLLALRRTLRDAGRWADGGEPDLSVLLDLVAVGTVADLVPLDFNNRLLVSAGLARLRRGQGQPGVRALAQCAGRDLARLVAADIGFAIGPRLNAAGRLEDMAVGIECLLADDDARAFELAATLDRINGERRTRQEAMVESADALLESLPPATGADAGVVLFDAQWHPGLVGLVASKVKERMHRPVVAFAPVEPGSADLRGSARSIPGLHIRDVLAEMEAREPGLIERFGGHAMAAGLSLPLARLDAFRALFADVLAARMDPALLAADLLSDGELDPTQFERGLAEALRLAGPWGQGFAEPLFDNVFAVKQWRVLGERHLKFVLVPEGGHADVAAIHFGGYAGAAPPPRIRAAYQLDLDDWKDRRGVQLLVRHWEPA